MQSQFYNGGKCLQLLCMLLLAAVSARSQAIITNIAGNGITQYIGDGFPATDLSLAVPSGICMHATTGDLYIADYAVARVRKLTPGGTISTYGGNGTLGFGGDGGPATNAQLREPTGTALDATGNLYITEEYNNRVRRIDAATGIISTIAGSGAGGYGGDGGNALLAAMEQPAGLCIDKWNNMYIADRGNHRIRRVDAATGIITTVAGNGLSGYGGDSGPATAAMLSSPMGVCTDTAGNLYIADKDNNAVRRVQLSTGIITTVAGTGAADYSGDNGPATAAKLVQPYSVYMSSRSNLYIADFGNNRIRVVTTDGIMHTLAGSGLFGFVPGSGPALEARLGGPTGVCADAAENVYFTDGGNSATWKVSPVYNAVPPVTAAAGGLRVLPNPAGDYMTIILPTNLSTTVAVLRPDGAVAGSYHSANGRLTLDVSELPAGVYYLQATGNNAMWGGRFTVVH